MARRALATAVATAATALALAACGSSHHPPKNANPGGPNIPATSSSSSSVNPGGPDIPASSSASSSTSQTSTAPASTSTATTSTTTASHPAPRGGAHLDARFHLGAGGAVTPSQVLLPSGVPIVLQLVNTDAHAHAVSLTGATNSSVRLPAGGTASERLGHLHKGTYRLVVDGHTAARLVIGVAPGP